MIKFAGFYAKPDTVDAVHRLPAGQLAVVINGIDHVISHISDDAFKRLKAELPVHCPTAHWAIVGDLMVKADGVLAVLPKITPNRTCQAMLTIQFSSGPDWEVFYGTSAEVHDLAERLVSALILQRSTPS